MHKLIMEDQPMPIILGGLGLILNLIYCFKAKNFLQDYGIKNFGHLIRIVPKIVQNNDVERLGLLTLLGSTLVIGLLMATWYCAISPIIDSVFESNILWWLTIVVYIINAGITVFLIKVVLLLWILLIICGIYSAASSNSVS